MDKSLINRLIAISNKISDTVAKKEKEYQGSWKKRGGIGAFMMLCRKWDRIESAAERSGWDIFRAVHNDYRPEGILDDIDDLIGYLLLVRDHCYEKSDNTTADVSTEERLETTKTPT